MTPGLKESGLFEDCEVWAWEEDRVMPEKLFREKAQEVDGLFATTFDPIDALLLDACPNLRVVSIYAVGVDNVDLPAAVDRGVPVGNTPYAVTEATADIAFGLKASRFPVAPLRGIVRVPATCV